MRSLSHLGGKKKNNNIIGNTNNLKTRRFTKHLIYVYHTERYKKTTGRECGWILDAGNFFSRGVNIQVLS